MKYDVFISYSRTDLEEVSQFVELLRKCIPSLTLWFDITGIESGDEFEEKIIAAIDNSSNVLYFLSDNSIQSKWTKDEVMYAKNTEKRVVPVLLKGAKLKGWFLFKFGRIDCIDSTNSTQVEKLLRNLSEWTGKTTGIKNDDSKQRWLKTEEKKRVELSSQDDGADKFINGHEYVDLGLSVKWATCNVGATKPEEYGGYYAWGETEEKSEYSLRSYKWCKDAENSMTKYCNNSHYGTVDNRTTLEPSDDIAHIKWGDSWRMPTIAEIKELVEKCTWEWTSVNGVYGYSVTGPNGNSIFLPAAGYRYGTEVYYTGYYGDFWSSTPDESDSSNAYVLNFNNNGYGDWGNWSRRYDGHSVRPVSE